MAAGKLVLQIREGEWILIGSEIIVTLERIQGARTSISVAAPKDVKILRGKLVEEQQRDGSEM
jgi:sRNA-binding carbon storage regulator CsrA